MCMRLRTANPRWHNIVNVAALVVIALTASARAQIAAPVNYQFQQPLMCSLPSSIRDEGYGVCDDQMALFQAAQEQAAAAHKLLLVEIVATWCPDCHRLRDDLPGPALFGAEEGFLPAERFDRVTIVTSTIASGKKVDIISGDAVRKLLLCRCYTAAQFRGWPFLIMVDPTTKRVAAYNTEFLAKDSAPLRQLLSDVSDAFASGQPAPNEPTRPSRWRRFADKLFGG